MKPKVGKKYSRMIQNKDNSHKDPVYVPPFKGGQHISPDYSNLFYLNSKQNISSVQF